MVVLLKWMADTEKPRDQNEDFRLRAMDWQEPQKLKSSSVCAHRPNPSKILKLFSRHVRHYKLTSDQIPNGCTQESTHRKKGHFECHSPAQQAVWHPDLQQQGAVHPQHSAAEALQDDAEAHLVHVMGKRHANVATQEEDEAESSAQQQMRRPAATSRFG